MAIAKPFVVSRRHVRQMEHLRCGWGCPKVSGAGVVDMRRYRRNARQRRAIKRMTRTPEEITYTETNVRKSNV